MMFIYREEVYKRDEENEGKADLIISKQRNGPIGIVKLAFLKQYTKFETCSKRTDRIPVADNVTLAVFRPAPAPGSKVVELESQNPIRLPAMRLCFHEMDWPMSVVPGVELVR